MQDEIMQVTAGEAFEVKLEPLSVHPHPTTSAIGYTSVHPTYIPVFNMHPTYIPVRTLPPVQLHIHQ